ncbi:MAG: hypothetical protein ABI782_07410 [Anaerolineaceae bacterium]
MVLPADPEGSTIKFDSAFWAWVGGPHRDPITGQKTSWGSMVAPAADAACIVERPRSGGTWERAIAVERSGVVEMLAGSEVAFAFRDAKAFNLGRIVALVWNALTVFSELKERDGVQGPYLCVLAVTGTNGSFLGGFADGWRQLGDFQLEPSSCLDDHLLFKTELGEWPDSDGVRQLAFDFGDRLGYAWGQKERRFLLHRAGQPEQFDKQRWSW